MNEMRVVVALEAIEKSCATCEAKWVERHRQAQRDHDRALQQLRDDQWHEGMGGDALQ